MRACFFCFKMPPRGRRRGGGGGGTCFNACHIVIGHYPRHFLNAGTKRAIYMPAGGGGGFWPRLCFIKGWSYQLPITIASSPFALLLVRRTDFCRELVGHHGVANMIHVRRAWLLLNTAKCREGLGSSRMLTGVRPRVVFFSYYFRGFCGYVCLSACTFFFFNVVGMRHVGVGGEGRGAEQVGVRQLHQGHGAGVSAGHGGKDVLLRAPEQHFFQL